jgi:flagellar basal body-associated protein FliL
MLQEILQKAEEIIHRQMTEKFGLTQEESERSTKAFRDELTEFIQNSPLLKGNLLENAFGNLQQIKDSKSFEEFKVNLATALEEKAGLSPEMAAAVRDFSISTFYQTFKEELTDEQGQIDLGKVVHKLNLGNLETTARELLGSFSQRFGGK